MLSSLLRISVLFIRPTNLPWKWVWCSYRKPFNTLNTVLLWGHGWASAVDREKSCRTGVWRSWHTHAQTWTECSWILTPSYVCVYDMFQSLPDWSGINCILLIIEGLMNLGFNQNSFQYSLLILTVDELFASILLYYIIYFLLCYLN